jgi:hypothetical protein
MATWVTKNYSQEEIKTFAKAVHDEMYSIENTIKRRGYVYIGEGDERDVILPKGKSNINEYFKLMKSRTFRSILKKCLDKKTELQLNDFKPGCDQNKLMEYINYLENSGIICKKSQSTYDFSLNINNFGHTLEWYIAELFKRELGCTAGWGIRVEDIDTGGDFDILARIESSLAYIETKSSPNNISESEIRHFLHRDQHFNPNISIFLVDTRNDLSNLILKFENIITEAEIEQEHKRDANYHHKIEQPTEIHGVYFTLRRVFITNSEPSILTKLRYCLKYYSTILPNLTFWSREVPLNFIK